MPPIPAEWTWLLPWAAPWGLVMARASGVAWTAPAWGTAGLGWRLRLMLAGLLTAAIAPVVGPGLPIVVDPLAMARGVAGELAIGTALGWSAALIVAAARQAGEVVGAQAGFSAAALLDPDAGEGLTPLGHLYGLFALAVFLALDGPLTLVGALVESYRVLPAASSLLSAESATRAFGLLGQSLDLTLRLAAPTALALILAGLALALIARAAPAFPFLSLALPIRSFVGLLLVLAGLAALAAAMANAWGAWPGMAIGYGG